MEENEVITHGSLFSGIGGFDLAAETVGFENIFSCEIDDYCDKLLKQNFPNVKRYKDIYEFDAREYNGRIDIVSGGFPCQPFSVAGKRQGANDDRHLWPQMLRVIAEINPRWVVAENVPGLLTISDGMVFEQCCLDLEAEGYKVQAFIIPAISKNAPHRRDRLWIIANSNSSRLQETRPELEATRITRNDTRIIANSNGDGDIRFELQSGVISEFRQRWACDEENCNPDWSAHWYEVATKFCRVDDGVPNRVDRIKALGNAIVPQVAIEIFKAIKYAEGCKSTTIN